MGQKVHPYIIRIGFAKTWQSLWFTVKKREFASFLEFLVCNVPKPYSLKAMFLKYPGYF